MTMTSYHFAAQYQQNPQPPEGNVVKREWLNSTLQMKIPPLIQFCKARIQRWKRGACKFQCLYHLGH